MRAIILAAALFAAAPAFAQPTAPAPTRAVLVDAAKAPSGRTVIDGAAWRGDLLEVEVLRVVQVDQR